MFANFLQIFANDKKQIKCIRKMIFLYYTNKNDEDYLLNETDKKEIDYFTNGIRNLSISFYKAKNIDDYNRSKQMLERYQSELSASIEQTKLKLVELRGQDIVEKSLKKIKHIGSVVNDRIDKIKSTVNKAIGDLDQH